MNSYEDVYEVIDDYGVNSIEIGDDPSKPVLFASWHLADLFCRGKDISSHHIYEAETPTDYRFYLITELRDDCIVAFEAEGLAI